MANIGRIGLSVANAMRARNFFWSERELPT